MRRVMLVIAAAILVPLLATTSCTTLLVQDLGQLSDDWQVWIEEARRSEWCYAGDRAVPTYDQNVVYEEPSILERSEPVPKTWSGYCPTEGNDFVFVVLRLQNRQPDPRTFDLTAVRLIGGHHGATPVLLYMNCWLNWPAEPRPELDAGEEIVRKLVFTFPKELAPDRLVAVGLTIALPAPDPAD